MSLHNDLRLINGGFPIIIGYFWMNRQTARELYLNGKKMTSQNKVRKKNLCVQGGHARSQYFLKILNIFFCWHKEKEKIYHHYTEEKTAQWLYWITIIEYLTKPQTQRRLNIKREKKHLCSFGSCILYWLPYNLSLVDVKMVKIIEGVLRLMGSQKLDVLRDLSEMCKDSERWSQNYSRRPCGGCSPRHLTLPPAHALTNHFTIRNNRGCGGVQTIPSAPPVYCQESPDIFNCIDQSRPTDPPPYSP